MPVGKPGILQGGCQGKPLAKARLEVIAESGGRMHEHRGAVSNEIAAGPTRLRGSSTVFCALGNAGQVMLVNPAEDAVVVKWAVWASPANTEERWQQGQTFFAALLDVLK